MRAYIGIDNGVTGSLAFLRYSEVKFMAMPVIKEQNYTKKKRLIRRIDWHELYEILEVMVMGLDDVRVFLERPYTGKQTHTVISAMRSLEATLITIEQLELSYQYVDSRPWQKALLPSGTKESDELKKASVDIGCRLFPQLKAEIRKHKDADSLLIAEWARREGL